MNKIEEIELSKIDSFKNHPFKVNNDESLKELSKSIKENGLLNPLLVRKKENDRYELISGHRRKLAMENMGLTKANAIVKDLTYEEAIVEMVDSNMYRDKMAILDLEEVKNNNGKCYIAVENNKAIGLIMGCVFPYGEYDYLDYKCPKRGEITELIVTNKTRSKGIGQELINKIEEYFKSVGCDYVIVDVFSYNEIGKQFYNKNDYHSRMETMIKKI